VYPFAFSAWVMMPVVEKNFGVTFAHPPSFVIVFSVPGV
jgi:hypothetical protein